MKKIILLLIISILLFGCLCQQPTSSGGKSSDSKSDINKSIIEDDSQIDLEDLNYFEVFDDKPVTKTYDSDNFDEPQEFVVSENDDLTNTKKKVLVTVKEEDFSLDTLKDELSAHDSDVYAIQVKSDSGEVKFIEVTPDELSLVNSKEDLLAKYEPISDEELLNSLNYDFT